MDIDSGIIEIFLKNLNNIELENLKKIILVYEGKYFYIGDMLFEIQRYRKGRMLFQNAHVDFNIRNKKHFQLMKVLTKNNTYIDNNMNNLAWDEIDFEKYDLVVFIDRFREDIAFLNFIIEKYKKEIQEGIFKTPIEATLFYNYVNEGNIYSKYYERRNKLKLQYEDDVTISRQEVFISKEERDWSEEWLIENGFIPGNHLSILLDTSTRREKCLPISEYFKIIEYLLRSDKNQILIFDENMLGKEELYISWLGEHVKSKIIFANGLNLRKALCLLSNKNVKFIFGPSTGLLHCASGIYNVFSYTNQISSDEIPLMVTYVAEIEGNENFNEWFWWGKSLVNCIAIQKDGNTKKIKKLQDCPVGQEAFNESLLPIENYSATDIIDFIKSNFTSIINNIN